MGAEQQPQTTILSGAMSIALDDERLQWLRKHVPCPLSVTNKATLRINTNTNHPKFGQYYQNIPQGTAENLTWKIMYHGQPLDEGMKSRILKEYVEFKNTLPSRTKKGVVSQAKRKGSGVPEKQFSPGPGNEFAVPVILYTKDGEPPEQLIVHGQSIAGGVVFNWQQELSRNVPGHINATFQRWTEDGNFSRPREHIEWVPEGKLLIYKLEGVVNCAGIEEFTSANEQQKEHASVPIRFPMSPPPSSPARGSGASTSKSILGRKRSATSETRKTSDKRPRNSSTANDVYQNVISLVSDDSDNDLLTSDDDIIDLCD